MVWAGAWLGPTLPTVYHQLVVGVKTGTGFPVGKTHGFRQLGGQGDWRRSG